ncbi:MAG: hypothetical protein JST00_10795 [Deltaproteobacteria bacterium]|nr:hypothetical protein [Deltaproteobacteria bacterium]
MKPSALALPLGVVIAACGGPAEPARAARADVPAGAAPATSSSAGVIDPLPPLEALVARGPSAAPLMREVQRLPDARVKADLETRRDTCFRAVLASSRAVKAYFADEKGTPRGDALEGLGGEGVVPPNGPACVKRGDVVRFVVESDAAVRAVVFAAP